MEWCYPFSYRKKLFVIFLYIKIMTYLLFPLTMLSPNTEGDREALGYRAVSRHPGIRYRNIRKLKQKIFWRTQECDHVVPGREAEVRVLDPVHPHTHQVAPASTLSTVIIRCGVLAIFSLYYGPNRVRVVRSRVDTQISTQTMANGWWPRCIIFRLCDNGPCTATGWQLGALFAPTLSHYFGQ